MPFFRRSRPLHEQLAERAGLDIGAEPPGRVPSRLGALAHGLVSGFLTSPPDEFGRPSPLGEVAFHGVSRPRVWDAVATAAADLPGAEVNFVALADGTLVVEEEVPDGSLTPLAEAIEQSLAPPYRALAVRQDERIWAVGANRVDVRAFPDQDGDELELVEDDHVLVARRLDGDLFEVEVTPL